MLFRACLASASLCSLARALKCQQGRFDATNTLTVTDSASGATNAAKSTQQSSVGLVECPYVDDARHCCTDTITEAWTVDVSGTGLPPGSGASYSSTYCVGYCAAPTHDPAAPGRTKSSCAAWSATRVALNRAAGIGKESAAPADLLALWDELKAGGVPAVRAPTTRKLVSYSAPTTYGCSGTDGCNVATTCGRSGTDGHSTDDDGGGGGGGADDDGGGGTAPALKLLFYGTGRLGAGGCSAAPVVRADVAELGVCSMLTLHMLGEAADASGSALVTLDDDGARVTQFLMYADGGCNFAPEDIVAALGLDGKAGGFPYVTGACLSAASATPADDDGASSTTYFEFQVPGGGGGGGGGGGKGAVAAGVTCGVLAAAAAVAFGVRRSRAQRGGAASKGWGFGCGGGAGGSGSSGAPRVVPGASSLWSNGGDADADAGGAPAAATQYAQMAMDEASL